MMRDEVEKRLSTGLYPEFFCSHVRKLLDANEGGEIFWKQMLVTMDSHIELISKYETPISH